MDGHSINVVSKWIFGWGDWIKGHLVSAQLLHCLQTKQLAPHRDSVSVCTVFP